MTPIGLLFWGEMDSDRFIRRAFQLALRGRGAVSPNPRVGALIVSETGSILSEGWHRKFGGPHAELDALDRLPEGAAQGASLYVTLEPCSYHNHTPPCTDAIIQAGIKRIYSVTRDPNPKVNGRGFDQLRRAGLDVRVIGDPLLGREVNRGFFTWMEQGRAWCEAKIALSIDGKMADHSGMSKWISGEKSRRLAHKLRADLDAVLVGGGTVRADDPELTVRMVKGSNPARIVLSPECGISPGSKLALSARDIRTICIINDLNNVSLPDNIEVVALPAGNDGLIDPLVILKKLPELGLLSALLEGGAGVLSSFMTAGVIDRITVAYSPSIIGRGKSPFEQFLPNSWADRPVYRAESVRRLGEDVIVQYGRRTAISSRG